MRCDNVFDICSTIIKTNFFFDLNHTLDIYEKRTFVLRILNECMTMPEENFIITYPTLMKGL